MAVFTVLYPAQNGATFDHDYYRDVHIPLAKEAFASTGLTDVQVLKGLAGVDGGPAPFVAMALLTFRDAEAMQASLTGPRSAEVRGDVANFTTIQSIIQISEAN
ncbi:EthD family reductase [Caulobacter segnis]|uniref:Ethyl tert-butyl ether degradation EthD n=2 Tax=Caulobacter segnis TaxID=88688 RepID=D5VE03_CAUST|nr:EthD family reductase [Caulobacter segnis]ADG08703.1 Ethyl tert-butyl ether degradation EthD [Caulobacter segnis ATCC 21756]AVQ00553.1 EthD family reductase [Caulobacter segnis]